MNILIIGGGGREHALAWAVAASPLITKLYCAPGNAGISQVATCLPIGALDFDQIINACKEHDIDFVIVGPDDPLAEGLVDRLNEERIKAFGPTRAAAQLEASKSFTKELCKVRNIPTAGYGVFDTPNAALAYLSGLNPPFVIKADGLALGKGVIIASTREEAEAAIGEMFAGAFGDAGKKVLIEEFLTGEEASFFALTDGKSILPLASAQDHKRVGEGDVGLNTGGMGAYSPAPIMTEAMTAEVMDRIIRPTVEGMAERGTPYRGVLYAGLMITSEGPKLIEYNARFGDPECQVLMPRLRSDILPALIAVADGVLGSVDLRWLEETALTVVMATEGYPKSYEKGSHIRGIEAAEALEDVTVFHAGTKSENGALLANGGRVLNITALGKSVTEAAETAYKAVDLIDWPEGFCRRDIGWRAIDTGKSKSKK